MKLSVIIVNYNVKHYIAQCVDSVFCALGGTPGIDGEVVADMPFDTEGCEAVYETLPGWKCDLTHMTSEEEFPKALNNFIRFIEDYVQIPIRIVSVGPYRKATIIRH